MQSRAGSKGCRKRPLFLSANQASSRELSSEPNPQHFHTTPGHFRRRAACGQVRYFRLARDTPKIPLPLPVVSVIACSRQLSCDSAQLLLSSSINSGFSVTRPESARTVALLLQTEAWTLLLQRRLVEPGSLLAWSDLGPSCSFPWCVKAQPV